MNSRWKRAIITVRNLLVLQKLIYQIDEWVRGTFSLTDMIPRLMRTDVQRLLRSIRRDISRGPLANSHNLFGHLRWDLEDRYFYFHGRDGPAYDEPYTLLITGWDISHRYHKCTRVLSLPISPCSYCGLACHTECSGVVCPFRDRRIIYR